MNPVVTAEDTAILIALHPATAAAAMDGALATAPLSSPGVSRASSTAGFPAVSPSLCRLNDVAALPRDAGVEECCPTVNLPVCAVLCLSMCSLAAEIIPPSDGTAPLLSSFCDITRSRAVWRDRAGSWYPCWLPAPLLGAALLLPLPLLPEGCLWEALSAVELPT